MIDCHQDAQQTLWLCLNRPDKAHALSPDMLSHIIQALKSYQDSAHCLVIHSTGKHFCSGADLNTLQSCPHQGQLWLDFFTTLEQFPVPVLSLCHGYAGGGGLGILAASDLIFATETTQWILPEAQHGLIPATVLPLLQKRWPEPIIRRLCMHPQPLTGQRLYQLGLIDQLTQSKQLIPLAQDWIHQLASYDHQALKQLKIQLRPSVQQPPLKAFLTMHSSTDQK